MKLEDIKSEIENDKDSKNLSIKEQHANGHNHKSVRETTKVYKYVNQQMIQLLTKQEAKVCDDHNSKGIIRRENTWNFRRGKSVVLFHGTIRGSVDPKGLREMILDSLVVFK